MTEINIVMAEGLVIGPKDRLIIKVNDRVGGRQLMQDLSVRLAHMGLADRSLVLMGDIELTKIEGE